MFIRIRDSHTRSVTKAVTWRIIGSLDTFFITFLITGNWASAGSVASLETLSKIVLFYLHERVWQKVPTGHSSAAPVPAPAEAGAPGQAAALPFTAQLATPAFHPASPADALPPMARAGRECPTHRVFQGSDS